MHQILWRSMVDMNCPTNLTWVVNVHLVALPFPPWLVDCAQVVVEALSKQGLGSAFEAGRRATTRYDKVGGQGPE